MSRKCDSYDSSEDPPYVPDETETATEPPSEEEEETPQPPVQEPGIGADNYLPSGRARLLADTHSARLIRTITAALLGERVAAGAMGLLAVAG